MTKTCLVFAIFTILMLATMRAWCADSKTPADDLRHLQLLKTQGLVIIDVRNPDAYAKGHIQGAKNIPAQALGNAQLPKDSQIVVYCGEDACSLSDQAAQSLLAAGYAKVQTLAGGFADWLKRGYPAQTGVQQAVKPKYDRISAKDAQERLGRDELIPVDVRPALEFSAGRIPHARNVPLEQLDSGMAGLPKDKTILVYDRDAKRSKQAMDKLLSAGFKPVELLGGLAGWVRKKYLLEIK